MKVQSLNEEELLLLSTANSTKNIFKTEKLNKFLVRLKIYKFQVSFCFIECCHFLVVKLIYIISVCTYIISTTRQ